MGRGQISVAVVVMAAVVMTLAPMPTEQRAEAATRRRFRNVTAPQGVATDASRTWGSTFLDYDGDGWSDILLGRHWGWPLLFAGTGTGFVQRAPEPFKAKGFDRHNCAWGEVNGDRRPDVYCVQGADKGTGSGANQLSLQSRDGDLRAVTKRYGVVDLYGRGRTVNWMDVDGDGDLDLFVGNLLRKGYPNRLFINRRGSFTSVDRGLARELNTRSSSWADWDRDGDPDLLVNQYYGRPTMFFRNDRGRFRSVALPGVTGGPWYAGAWGDYDGDGWIDLHVVSGNESRVFRNVRGRMRSVHRTRLNHGRMSSWLDVDNDGDLDLFIVQGAGGTQRGGDTNAPDVFLIKRDGGFRKRYVAGSRGPSSGNGEAVSVSDLDRDMRMDLYVTNGMDHWNGKAYLYRNVGTAAKAAEIRLIGTRWNPWGFGARVGIRKPGSDRVRWHHVTDGVSFHSQSDASLIHVGLGRRNRARAKIVWPGGATDCRTIFAGRVTRIKRNAHAC